MKKLSKAEKNEIKKSLLENARTGLLEITTKNGINYLKITEKGREYVKAMPFKNQMSSAKWLNEYDEKTN